MLLSIRHKTELLYAEPITESVIELRMMPRNDEQQALRSFELGVGPEAPVFEHSDWQGNRAHHFSIVDVHDRVQIVAASTVDTRPMRFRLQELTDLLPFGEMGHRLQDFLLPHGPVQKDPRLVAFAESAGLFQERRAAMALASVVNRLSELITYTKGVTNSATSVSDVLSHGQGVCQDYAHVALSLLRSLGIPARYLSGYLYRPESVELETHAWVEAFVPSFGWIGLDPTHGQLTGESHVAVAVGRSYADVPPNRGVYRGGAEERINVSVQIQELASDVEPTALAVPRPDVRLLFDRVLRERRLDMHALEQQRQQQQQQQQQQ